MRLCMDREEKGRLSNFQCLRLLYQMRASWWQLTGLKDEGLHGIAMAMPRKTTRKLPRGFLSRAGWLIKPLCGSRCRSSTAASLLPQVFADARLLHSNNARPQRRCCPESQMRNLLLTGAELPMCGKLKMSKMSTMQSAGPHLFRPVGGRAVLTSCRLEVDPSI